MIDIENGIRFATHERTIENSRQELIKLCRQLAIERNKLLILASVFHGYTDKCDHDSVDQCKNFIIQQIDGGK